MLILCVVLQAMAGSYRESAVATEGPFPLHAMLGKRATEAEVTAFCASLGAALARAEVGYRPEYTRLECSSYNEGVPPSGPRLGIGNWVLTGLTAFGRSEPGKPYDGRYYVEDLHLVQSVGATATGDVIDAFIAKYGAAGLSDRLSPSTVDGTRCESASWPHVLLGARLLYFQALACTGGWVQPAGVTVAMLTMRDLRLNDAWHDYEAALRSATPSSRTLRDGL